MKAVLVILKKDNEVLLINKKRGHGVLKVNFPGGKLMENESFYDAAVREVYEEVGVKVSNLKEVATLEFEGQDLDSVIFTKVFLSSSFEGTFKETDEAEPFFMNINEIPYQKMWDTDILWVPSILYDSYVNGKFYFKNERLISKEIKIKDLF